MLSDSEDDVSSVSSNDQRKVVTKKKASDDIVDVSLNVNRKFAAKYEDRKRAEELARARDRGIDLDDDSSSAEGELVH
jgi:hypothetical protein